ncbi:MAG: hypothetical protein MUE54_09775 [Anaerolineae bacterium]|nr:hypothetical protein [Anaerolineae bacterium]
MQNSPMYQFTSVSRPLNPLVYPTHRLLVVLVPIAGIILGAYTLWTRADFGIAVTNGLYAGASALLAWIFAREIDPDNNTSAFIALGLSIIGSIFATPNIWALAGAVTLVRIVNRIVGFPAKITDSIMAIALGVLTMLITGAWVFGVVVAVAFLLDAILPDQSRIQWSFLLGMLLIMLPTWAYLNVSFVQNSQNFLPLVLGVSAVFMAHILTLPRLTCQCDAVAIAPNRMRVQAGMALLLGMAVVFALVDGDWGVRALMPLWASFAGVLVYRAGMLVIKRG